MKTSSSGFTNECAERSMFVSKHTSEASEVRKPVRGFTLLETLIAVTILTFAVAGPLYTANRAVIAVQSSRDQLSASYLAQEGIEYVRWMRDNEFLSAYRNGGANVSANAWTAFISGGDSASISQCRSSTCTLDPTRPMGSGSGFALQPCSGGACVPLYIANGIYTEQSGLSGAVRTPFTRTVQALDIPAQGGGIIPTEVRIVSTVTWTYHNIPYTITVTDHLTSWQ